MSSMSNIKTLSDNWTMEMFSQASRLKTGIFYATCLKREEIGWRAFLRTLKLRGSVEARARNGARKMTAKWIRDNILG